MSEPLSSVSEWHHPDAATFRQEIAPRQEPAILRGVAADWPAVAAASESTRQGCDYLLRFDCGAPVEAFVGLPGIRGRFFYRPDLRGFNFERRRGRFGDILRHLLDLDGHDEAPAVYVGAAAIPECLPGFDRENSLDLSGTGAVPRIWVGNRTEVSTHFDLSHNIACVVAGRRRFTLFPPDQLANLYVGPLDFTMAGQPASMVALNEPDFQRYPRFREALAAARRGELGPGDAIYIPALWWHHVDALSSFNVLVNYWWEDAPAHAGSPFEALAHGIWAIAHLPAEQRGSWRRIFDHYVFRTGGDPAEHLAREHRGILGPPSPQLSERIRQFLLRVLSRRRPG